MTFLPFRDSSAMRGERPETSELERKRATTGWRREVGVSTAHIN